MPYDLITSPKAKWDLVDIRSYYSNTSNQLSDRFYNHFFETLDYIREQPLLYQIRYKDVRIAPLNNFPYAIHYVIEDEQIIILRVFHTSRYFK